MVKVLVRARRIKDWLDSDSCDLLVKALERELDLTYKMSADLFVPGNPNLTQEGKAKLVGQERMLHDLLAFFKEKEIEVLFSEDNGFEVIDE